MYTTSFILTSVSTEVGRIEGSLSDQILCFNRPVLPCGSGYFYDLLRVDPNDIIDTQILIVNPASQTYGTMYAKPLSFRLLFEARLLGCVADSFLRIWLPVPPTGFTALGLCVSVTEHPPDNFYCIRSEFTARPQEEDINSFSFLILRSPVTANLSLIRSHYLSFSVNSYLPVLHPTFLLSLQKQTVIKDIPAISQLFDYIPKPKSRRVDPAVDRHVLLKLILYKIMSDTGPKASHSISTPKIGTSRSVRLSSGSMAGGINMSRFSRSGLTSRIVDEVIEMDEDLTTVYLVRPAKGPWFGDSISTKNSVVPHDTVLALLSQENECQDAAVASPIISRELVRDIFAPCIGFNLVAVMPSSFAPPEKRSAKRATDDRGSSVSCASESTALNETYTLDENRAAAHRASQEPQVVKYTYVYAPVAPDGYTALSVVLGDETGEPPEPSSVLAVNSKYVVYTDAFSTIGELYDRESAEYCYIYLKTQNKMLEERRQAATVCFSGDRNEISTADRFTRPILTDVPLPPPSYSTHPGLGTEHGAAGMRKLSESPLRNNEQVAFSADPSTTATTTRTGTALTEHQDAVQSCLTSGSRLGGKSATLSDLPEDADLDQLVRPIARPVQLVTPRGSPFIFVNDPGAESECTESTPPKFPIISPAILNFVFSAVSTSSKDLLAGVTIEKEYTKVVTLDLSAHKLQFIEPIIRKPSYSCFGSIVYWTKQIAASTQPLKPPTPQQPSAKPGSSQRSASAKNIQQPQEPDLPLAAPQASRAAPDLTGLPPELGLISKSSGFDSYVFSEPDALVPIWSSEDLEGDNKIVVYEMIPQLGYAALGCAVSLSGEVPRKSRYCCVSLAFVSRMAAIHIDNGIQLPQVAGFDRQYLIAPRYLHSSELLSNNQCGIAYFNLRRFINASEGAAPLDSQSVSPITWAIKDQLLKAIGNQQQPKASEHNDHSNLTSQIEAFGVMSPSLELVLELAKDATSQVIVDERFDCGPSRDGRLVLLLQEVLEAKKPGFLLAAKSTTVATTIAATTVTNQSTTENSTAKPYKEKQASRGGPDGASKLPRSTSGKRPDGLPLPPVTEPAVSEEESKENLTLKQFLVTLVDSCWFTFGTRHVSTILDLIPVVKNTLSDSVSIASNGSFARPAEVRYLASVQIGGTKCLVFRLVPLPNYVSLGDIIVPAQLLSTVPLSSGSKPSQEQDVSTKDRRESISLAEVFVRQHVLCVHLSFCEHITLKTVQPIGHDLSSVPLSTTIVSDSQARTMLSGTSCLTDISKQRSGQAVSSTKTSLRPSDSAKNSTLNLTTLGEAPNTKSEASTHLYPQPAPFVGISQENVENVRSNSGRFTPSRSKSRNSAGMRRHPDFLELYDDIGLPETENLTVEPPRPNTRGNNALILQQAQDLRCYFDIGHTEQYSAQQVAIKPGISSDLYVDSIGHEGLPGQSVSTGVLTLLVDGYREDGGNGCWIYSDGVHLFASLSPQKELTVPRLKASYLNQLSRKILLSKEEELNLLKSKDHDQTMKEQMERGELASTKGGSKTFSINKRHSSEQPPSCQLERLIDTPYDGIYYWMDPLPAYGLLCAHLAAGGKLSKEIGLEIEVRSFDEEVQKDLVSVCMVSISSLHVVSYEQALSSGKLLSGCPPAQQHDATRKSKHNDTKKPAKSSGPAIHKNVVINTPASRLDSMPDNMRPSVDVENPATKHSANAKLLRALFEICDALYAVEQFKLMGRDTILSFKSPQGYVLVSDKVPVVRTNETARPAFLGIEEGVETPAWFLIFEKALARCAGSYTNLYNMVSVELVLLVFQFIGFVPSKAGSKAHNIKLYYTPTEASLVNFSPESIELLLEQRTILNSNQRNSGVWAGRK